MKPAQVLDMQADFVKRFKHEDGMFRAYVAFAIEAAHGSTAKGARIRSRWTEVEKRAARYTLADGVEKSVSLAHAYRVTEEMTSLVMFAASKLDSSDRWDTRLEPTPFGFVRFDRPLVVKDVRGKTMFAHWMTWGPAASQRTSMIGEPREVAGTYMTFWCDNVEPDEVQEEFEREHPAQAVGYRRAAGRWSFTGVSAKFDGDYLGAPAYTISDEDLIELQHFPGEEHTVFASEFTNTDRYAHALFLLLNQEIVVAREEEVPRAARKRIERAPIPGRISVITLRRAASRKSEGETLVAWSHRWLVRSHWAWRRCGESKPGRQAYEKGYRVRVWIHGYVKGPEDRPLVATEHVYNLSR